ncbi:la-related 6-like protein [Labeo rohita]|uniref:La-related 6-like protein n=1 Tax=Labeo rohita TaxID=84645 RepID=A0A498P033_LABRO|nr:la-related 6-like protein [Labeo rohita]
MPLLCFRSRGRIVTGRFLRLKGFPAFGAGTSGGELEEESWQPPDPELIQKLVAQIEYYLSDENLEHDAFLLKHVRRNKLGFVSVKLLTSFKKI